MAPPYLPPPCGAYPTRKNTTPLLTAGLPHSPHKCASLAVTKSDNIFPKSSCQQVRLARTCPVRAFLLHPIFICTPFFLHTPLFFSSNEMHFNKPSTKYGTAIFAPIGSAFSYVPFYFCTPYSFLLNALQQIIRQTPLIARSQIIFSQNHLANKCDLLALAP